VIYLVRKIKTDSKIESNNYAIYLIAIVAIVAIIGIISLAAKKNIPVQDYSVANADTVQNLGGAAISKATNIKEDIKEIENIEDFQELTGTPNVIPTKGATRTRDGCIEIDQELIDSMPAGGSYLLLEPASDGTACYYVVEDLILPKALKVELPRDNFGEDAFLNCAGNTITNTYNFISGETSRGSGIYAVNSLIKRCKSINNPTFGFILVQDSLAEDCEAYDNGGHGFYIVDGSSAINCISYHDSFQVRNSIVENCEAYDSFVGFYMEYGSLAIDCIAHDNSMHGFLLHFNSVVENCEAYNNDYGFYMTNEAQANNCIAYDNSDLNFKIRDNSVMSGGSCIDGDISVEYVSTYDDFSYAEIKDSVNVYHCDITGDGKKDDVTLVQLGQEDLGELISN